MRFIKNPLNAGPEPAAAGAPTGAATAGPAEREERILTVGDVFGAMRAASSSCSSCSAA